MNVLETMMRERAADVAAARAAIPSDVLMGQAAHRRHRSLAARLAAGTTCVIAEIKKASPSAGLLQPDYSPERLARAYAGHGASALSILTEPRHFLGRPEHVAEARQAVDLPILRKDFLSDPYQVLEAAAWGADVVLAIVAALDDDRIQALYVAAMELGLEVLVEAHTAAEVQRALRFPNAIIGVNSRDLKTLKTDLNVARELAAAIPPHRLAIAESGISSRAEIVDLEARGYRGFLIGESLLASASPGAKLAELLGRRADGP